MKRLDRMFIWFLQFILILQNISCKKSQKEVLTDKLVVDKWVNMTLHILKSTPGNTPTYASRTLGYIGLSMYQSVAKSDTNASDLQVQLNGLDSLPLLKKSDKINWIISLNSAQASILKNIYSQTSDSNKKMIDSLENYILSYYSTNDSLRLINLQSASYGKNIAQRIFDWSKSDGGHKGYLKNFDKKLIFKQKPGGWQPPLYSQSFSHFPLHPHWGENRTFLKINDNLKDPTFIPFDTNKNSAYYKQFLQVYNKRKLLTQAEKESAIWWGDDPDETPTPPGHSYYLTMKVIDAKQNIKLIDMARLYAQVGISVADAFRNCWRWKYLFFSERPNTFITQHIDSNWESFWPDPPFPAFPSGHAIQAAATATVLANYFGEKIEIVDDLHQGRKKDLLRNAEYKTKTFHSFWEIADDTANSRFYGGIHCKQDNDAGLEKGKEIAQNILNLQWYKVK